MSVNPAPDLPAYWEMRATAAEKEMTEGRQRIAELEAERDKWEARALEAGFIVAKVRETLERPGGLHSYKKGGIHSWDCPACDLLKELHEALNQADTK